VEENDDGHKKHGHPYPLTTGVPRVEQLKNTSLHVYIGHPARAAVTTTTVTGQL